MAPTRLKTFHDEYSQLPYNFLSEQHFTIFTFLSGTRTRIIANNLVKI